MADGMRRAALNRMDIAIDVTFEPGDAYRATMHASPPRVTQTPVATQPPSRTVWWPLVVIGFFVVVCATLAFLKSPLAQHPSVAPYAAAALAKVG